MESGGDDGWEPRRWCERPCREEWGVGERPCAWFKAGARCQLAWGDLVFPLQYVVIFLAEINIAVALALLIDGTVRKRQRAASAKAPAAAQGPASSASHARLMAVIGIAFFSLAIASLDLNGGNRVLSVGWRIGFQATIRVMMELALFEVGDFYTLALRRVMPLGTTHSRRLRETTRFVARAVLVSLFSGGTAAWEISSVPKADREGCLLSLANTVRNVGTATIDLFFFLYTLRYARAAKRVVATRLSSRPSSKSLATDKRAAEILTTHIAVLCGCMGAVFSFALIAAFRNYAAGKYLCEQPACTMRAYPSRILWAFWYHLGLWIWVIVLVPNRLARRVADALSSCVVSADPRSNTVGGPGADRARHPDLEEDTKQEDADVAALERAVYGERHAVEMVKVDVVVFDEEEQAEDGSCRDAATSSKPAGDEPKAPAGEAPDVVTQCLIS